MSFLDNLESTLKALEAREEKDLAKIKEEQDRREAERAAALKRAPHAEALKTSPYINNLLAETRAAGRPLRLLPRFTWIGDILRLDANEKRMELTPTPDGIVAVLSVNGEQRTRIPVDLTSNPADLAKRWLA